MPGGAKEATINTTVELQEAMYGTRLKQLIVERFKWSTEEVRQLEVIDLVWKVDEKVNRAHEKLG